MSERYIFTPITEAKAEEVNFNFEKLFNGDFHMKLPIWTSDTRPSVPTVNRTIGLNTDFFGQEIYIDDEGVARWLVLLGRWSERPSAIEKNLARGSIGFNYVSGHWEGYTGIENDEEVWVLL